MMDFQSITLITRKGKRVLFRSTLEGRWSVYFDLMNFEWQYEPFRHEIGGGITYTPDFRVHEIGLIEVKPSREMLKKSLPRIEKFVAQSNSRVYAVCAPEVSPAVYILAKSPLKIIECDRLSSKIVLAGRSRLQSFKSEPELSSISIEAMIKASNAARLKRGESKTPEERDTATRWKRLAEQEELAAHRKIVHEASEKLKGELNQ
jgi:hypothetical protein